MRSRDLRAEMSPLLKLAFPLILGELGWVAMTLVDTIMVGRMQEPALNMAASALAGVLFNTVAFGIAGVLLGLDSVISEAFGAEDIPAANRWLLHGFAMASLLALALLAVFTATPVVLGHFPVDKQILVRAIPALRGLTWGVVPLLAYFVLRRYLQAAHQAKPIAFALISANLVNIAFDWLLIYGHRFAGYTVPAFGVVGSSWATSLARLYLMLVLVVALWRADRHKGFRLSATPLRIETEHLRRIWVLGAPVGAQILIEIAIFALVTSLIATFGALPLAGHEIALQCASTSFMVPLAICSATAVRVGHALGKVRIGTGTVVEAEAAGWSGILAGAAVMLISAICFLFIPGIIAGLFTPDPAVIAGAVPLLRIAACFQFFDGIQVVAAGAMRGAGKTTTPLWTHIVCYWLVGMPLGWVLAFPLHLGPRGLWMGLVIALGGAAVVLVASWTRLTRQLQAGL
ncbi:MAG: MATE family efflux transporter [Acidobacteriaceae bacterium]|nr:MATE family efflux transporter [Acidobacteriaceae bacterium]